MDSVELEKLKADATAGNASAQYELGLMYWHGDSVHVDGHEAVKWLRMAADQGYANAQYNLGSKYLYGEGVPQDGTEAVKWFQLAADQGHHGAISELIRLDGIDTTE